MSVAQSLVGECVRSRVLLPCVALNRRLLYGFYARPRRFLVWMIKSCALGRPAQPWRSRSPTAPATLATCVRPVELFPPGSWEDSNTASPQHWTV